MNAITKQEQNNFISEFQKIRETEVVFVNDIAYPIISREVLQSLTAKEVDDVNKLLIKLSNGRLKY